MSVLNDGNSSYPTTLDTYRLEVDDPKTAKTSIRASIVNGIFKFIENLQNELGLNPSGAYSTLAARLNQIATAKYLVRRLEITGTDASPQTINYSDLTAATGDALPSSFLSPLVMIVGQYQSKWAHKTDTEGLTSFEMAKDSHGTGSTVYVDLLIMECG